MNLRAEIILGFIAEYVMERIDVATSVAELAERSTCACEDLYRVTAHILSFDDSFIVSYRYAT